jgi:amino acid adenylation domain-containing protein
MSTHPDKTNISTDDLELLAYLLEDGGSVAAPAQKISRQEKAGDLPLSFAQQRLWFLDQLEPGQAAYNIPLALRLTGALQIAAFERALNEIIRRHDILRTTYKSRDAEPVQVVGKFEFAPLPVRDLSGLPAPEQEIEVRRLMRKDAQRPFDLARGPIWRAALLKRHATEHVFLWNVHHIASDAWSTEVFFRELAALYTAFCKGQPSPLKELPIQYADFAAWQRQWLTGETLENQLAYWRRQLAVPQGGTILELPAERPRPISQTFSGDFIAFSLARETTAALQRLSQQRHATLFMTLLAAFKTLLHRYTGQHDILVGSPIANRTRAEIEDLIGFFVNTLVLRTDMSANPTFSELLARVNEVALAAYAHQDVPFEKLVEDLQPPRDLGVSPFFQVMFIYQQHGGLGHADLPGLQLNLLESYSGVAKFDLTLAIFHRPEGLAGAIEFNTDLFEAATIRRMVGHFERLLESLAADPNQRIADLSMLPEREKRQLLVTWNDSKKTYPREICFHHLFEAQAARAPEAVAVVFENQQLTYGELNRRANQLAHHLRHLGVGPEVLVGLCVERSLDMVVGLLGILKAGGAYVPLDPAYPAERIAYVLADAQAPVLVAKKILIENLPRSSYIDVEGKSGKNENCKLVYFDGDGEKIAGANETNPGVQVTADNLAYAIYTSGSTGKPKGVAIPHRALANFLNSMRAAPGLTAQDILLAVTTLSFDIAGLELYLPLLVGGRVVLASRDVAADGRLLKAALDESGATAMQATPATWRMLLEAGRPGNAPKILCGGEALPADLAKQLLDFVESAQSNDRGASVWNMYGPTETTIWSAVEKIENQESPISIGAPIDNTQIYLLDRHLQLAPIGARGELCIGGDGLARGYLNRPELTAEKFIPSAYSENPGSRIYKTGDLARYLANGKIACLGRVDQQVKIRGFRIELGEIEAVCAQHPAVDQVAVVAREDEPNNKRLVAYLVSSAQSVPEASELRQFLRAKLPDYMLPAAFVFLESLPQTPNGKVDRRALAALAPAIGTREEIEAEPQNPVEKSVAEIWREVLGLTKVGLHENFFELGGHSLLAVRLFLEIERSFNRSLPLASIFKAPTIKELAAMISSADAVSHFDCLVALREKGDKAPLFCVSGYEGHTFVFRQMARYLSDEQPVYGLQYPGLEGGQQPLARIEEIAAEFIRSIRRVQPHGPYQLCGYCFGGLVVYEMAQQLVRQGQKIETLALFDAMAPGGVRAGTGESMDESLREQAAMAQLKLETDVPVENNGRHRGASLADWMEAVRQANILAHQRYQPQPYPGRVILFVPTKRGEGWQDLIIDPRNGWGELARDGVEVCAISGYHEKMFREPKVQKVAKKMRAYLNGAQNVLGLKSRQANHREAPSLEENLEAA